MGFVAGPAWYLGPMGGPSPQTPEHGPDEPDTEKPESPADLTGRSWWYVVRKTVREFSDDQCTDLAAALTYYSVLALFPAAIALLSLLGLVGQGADSVNTLLQILSDVGAGGVADTLRPTLLELSRSQSSGVAFVLGLVLALWSASGYVGAFGRGMNRIYEVREGRPIWKLRPTMLLVTLVTVVLTALVALALVITGPAARAVGDAIGVGDTAVLVWNIAKWPVMVVVVVLIVALLYYATPNVKQPKFRWISVGAVVAILVWALASALFGFYVANFSSYDKTYGSLAGVIVFLLWLWITNLALLFGAELDAELERGRELQAGIAAEDLIQLPPRDTRNIEKAARKEREDVERGRRLRLTHGQDDGSS
jgi:membrane protein